jgi:predicted RNase H-like HicB family nuclease
MRYKIALQQSEERYSVSVPGLPGCWSQGATGQEAIENIKDVIRECLAVVDEQLLARTPNGEKGKFLCGHDERHWFVCAVPERAGVRNVVTAKQALQPDFVQNQIVAKGVKSTRQLRRRNKAFTRQGEWFFVKADFEPPAKEVLRNERLSRGWGSKPHIAEFAYRRGGTLVHVHNRHAPMGFTEEQFRALAAGVRREPGWTRMMRDPELYAKGRVSHSDHKTVVLKGWHRVLMNTEAQARAAVNVAFLD